MVTTAADTRDWLLVAPWFRTIAQARPHRSSAPVIQMYATSDPMSAFMADPQLSLKSGTDDVVFEISDVEPPAPLPGFGGLRRSLGNTVATPTSTRKLYLDAHQRFYLVTMEARLDLPELRCVPAGRICEQGFVIRRVMLEGEPADTSAVTELLAAVRSAQDQVSLGVAYGLTSTSPALVDAQRQTDMARHALVQGLAEHGVVTRIEGWVKDPATGRGQWRALGDESPAEIDELAYPMHPLLPGTADDEHSGVGHALYFGLLPTASDETTDAGLPRFDDESLYEIRTFARRHKPTCRRRRGPRDCSGPLFWSQPTQRYQLAEVFDPRGTGNRPVNIKLPDLDSLAAHVKAMPPGRTAPVRMSSPTLLVPDLKDPLPDSGKERDEVCFFGIPLITIVASFVLQIFLGLVMFIFNLWWMLALKFCIPPSIGISAGIDAAISAEVPSFDVSLDIDVALETGVISSAQYNAIRVALVTVLTDHGWSADLAQELLDTQSLQSIRDAAAAQESAAGADRGPNTVAEDHVSRADFEQWERTFRGLVA